MITRVVEEKLVGRRKPGLAGPDFQLLVAWRPGAVGINCCCKAEEESCVRNLKATLDGKSRKCPEF